MAEVRGRNRPNAFPGTVEQVPRNDSHALPLHLERGETELRIEAQVILAQLAITLKVDTKNKKGSFSTDLDDKAKALAAARRGQRGAPNADTAWQELSDLIWEFDAHVQDELAANSVSQASGYQLGRGLAECYWALDPAEPGGWTGWTFLLGDQRCSELGRLVGRLSAYMSQYTPAAVAGSIEVWKKVAADPAWRGDGAASSIALRRQINRWYDLIIVGQDPSTLVKPAAVMRNFRTIGRAIKFFWLQGILLLGGAAGLGWLVYLLNSNGNSGAGKVTAGVLGVIGLSLASVTGFLKSSAQAMLKRLRQDAYSDLIAAAIQTAPPRRSSGPKSQKWKVHEAISARTLTTAIQN
jgi:hypothetical protein